MNQYASDHPANLFYYGEEHYFKTLEKLAIPLRQSARQMSMFIEQLDHQSEALSALRNAFAQLESMPIKSFYKGLEEVSFYLAKVDFMNPQPAMNTADFIDFMKIQNQLGAQVNELITHAMRIKN